MLIPCALRLLHRAAQYSATQINGKINEVQKQIGAKKKVAKFSLRDNDMATQTF